MADTWSLLYSFPNLVQFEIPHMDATAQMVRYVTKHATAWNFSSNLASSRRLTGNPGLPVDPQQPHAVSDNLQTLAYLSGVWWDIQGGRPAIPLTETFTSGLTRGFITYYEDPP